MLTWTSLALIHGYQRHISPRKGFCCAYRIRHGGPGCSGYARQTIEELGLLGALPRIRQRFADCKAAALAFSAEREEDRQARKKRGDRTCTYCADGACHGCDPSMCGRGGASSKGGGCDATPDCAPDCCSCSG